MLVSGLDLQPTAGGQSEAAGLLLLSTINLAVSVGQSSGQRTVQRLKIDLVLCHWLVGVVVEEADVLAAAAVEAVHVGFRKRHRAQFEPEGRRGEAAVATACISLLLLGLEAERSVGEWPSSPLQLIYIML